MPVVNTNSDLATTLAAASLVYPTTEVPCAEILLYLNVKVTIPASGTTPLLNANDTLTLVPAAACPVGSVLVPELSSVYCVTDPGTALVLDIGTVADPDKFADALSLTQAGVDVEPGTAVTRKTGKVGFDQSGTAPVGLATPYRFTTPEAIVATAVTVTSVSETVAHFTLAFRTKA